tara:strand:+ start:1831 stop:2523 length:693 start_codon:yes stop_codon:yes gene_type:complete
MTDSPGILALWNDCADEGIMEYERWYMAEHLPERVGVTGFRFGRRYVLVEGDRRFFTFYELDRPDVLWSDEYLQCLGNPSAWTQRVMPNFQNTIRTACRRAASEGHAMGGYAVTIRLRGMLPSPQEIEAEFKDKILPRLFGARGVCHAHLWIASDNQTPSKTAETNLRGEDEMLSWAIIVETVHEEDASQLVRNDNFVGKISQLASGEIPKIGVYRLIAVLTEEMMRVES